MLVLTILTSWSCCQESANGSQFAIVTGATGSKNNVCNAIAAQLAEGGLTMILPCRHSHATCAESISRYWAAHKLIGRYHIEFADFTNAESVLAFMDRMKNVYGDRISVLVNCAHAGSKSRIETLDGMELAFQVNIWTYYVLSHLFFNRSSDNPASVVNVASGFARFFDPETMYDIQWKSHTFDEQLQYRNSKAAEILLTWELDSRFASSNVFFNAVGPGRGMDERCAGGLPDGCDTPHEAAEAITWLALHAPQRGIHGRWYNRTTVNGNPGVAGDYIIDNGMVRRVTSLAPDRLIDDLPLRAYIWEECQAFYDRFRPDSNRCYVRIQAQNEKKLQMEDLARAAFSSIDDFCPTLDCRTQVCDLLGKLADTAGLVGIYDALEKPFKTGPVHHFGDWAMDTYGSSSGCPSLLLAHFHNQMVLNRYSHSAIHGLLFNWVPRHAEPTDTFWNRVLFADLRIARICTGIIDSRYKCLHGVGHGIWRFVTVGPRYSTCGEQNLFTLHTQENGAYFSSPDTLARGLKLCSATESTFDADACASGLYHDFMDGYFAFRGWDTVTYPSANCDRKPTSAWFWPCALDPTFGNVCMATFWRHAATLGITKNFQSVSTFLSNTSSFDTAYGRMAIPSHVKCEFDFDPCEDPNLGLRLRAACVYGQGHELSKSMLYRVPEKDFLSSVCMSILGGRNKYDILFGSCANATIDTVYGDHPGWLLERRQSFCSRQASPSWLSVRVYDCNARIHNYCGPFGGCR